ncbi:lysophospholipid acyltransferase family protein [Pseudomonas sp. AA-38]|uniref:lysophospholipid acyltransferase family protein n=1 Tax=Pseudomonas sp. AA-38 TaxID=3028807 RepID=UPI0023F90F2B|nr:lysophospholipid acyltransferase family protein [Pseudomonas sp. AA-38]
MAKLRLSLRLAHLALVILFGTLLAGIVSLCERVVRHDLMPLRQRLTRWFLARLGGALPFRVRVEGELPERPMLWVANHVSWTDIPLLGALQPISFLSKAEVRTWPVAGWLAHKAGTLFIRRGSGDSNLVGQQLTRHLQQGRHLLIFPEGTTTDGRALRTFHGRLLSSAIDSNVPLQPVAIRYLRDGQLCPISPFIGDDDMLSHLLRLLSSPACEVEIRLLQPVPCEARSRNELARHSQAMIARALQLETPVVVVPEAEAA